MHGSGYNLKEIRVGKKLFFIPPAFMPRGI